MSIDIHNYEEYLLDRFEGRLSADREKELDAFLRAHPEISRSLEDFEIIALPDEQVPKVYPKENLKKNIRPTPAVPAGDYEERMIMSVEGLLNESQEEELRVFLRLNPALEHDLELFRSTRLKADAPPAFPAKHRLYKKKAGLIIFRPAITGVAAAAVLILALAIRFLYFDGEMNAPAIQPASPTTIAKAVPIVENDAVNEPAKPAHEASQTHAGSMKNKPEPAVVMDRPASYRPGPSHTAALLPETTETGLSIIYDRRKLRISAFTEQQAPLMARALRNLTGRIGGNLRNNLDVENAGRDNFDFWTMAAAGVKGFGTLTDRDLELYLDKDEQGKVTSYALLDDDRRILARSRPQE